LIESARGLELGYSIGAGDGALEEWEREGKDAVERREREGRLRRRLFE